MQKRLSGQRVMMALLLTMLGSTGAVVLARRAYRGKYDTKEGLTIVAASEAQSSRPFEARTPPVQASQSAQPMRSDSPGPAASAERVSPAGDHVQPATSLGVTPRPSPAPPPKPPELSKEASPAKNSRGMSPTAIATAERAPVSAPAPRTTVQNPLRWSGPPEWRLSYMNPARLSPEEIAERRRANDQVKSVAQSVRDATLAAGSPAPSTDRR